MELLYAACVGLLVSCGVFLILRSRTFPVVLGLTMFSYAVNLFLFSSGRLSLNQAAVLGASAEYADPLPQAFVLTAIVIGFAMTAFVVILAIRGRADLGTDHVDGQVLEQKSKKKNAKRKGSNTDAIIDTSNNQNEKAKL
jgi:multicomponent K+:H+ antiporter subunit C